MCQCRILAIAQQIVNHSAFAGLQFFPIGFVPDDSCTILHVQGYGTVSLLKIPTFYLFQNQTNTNRSSLPGFDSQFVTN
jgi:hypothetical protein